MFPDHFCGKLFPTELHFHRVVVIGSAGDAESPLAEDRFRIGGMYVFVSNAGNMVCHRYFLLFSQMMCFIIKAIFL